MLSKRLDELGLDEIDDVRDDRGKRWGLGTLLRACLGSMLSGAKSLAEVEALSERMSRPTRRILGVQRRLPDTTLRIFELALDSLCCAYRGLELFKLVTYDAGACSAHNATLIRARDLHYLFGLTAGQPTLLQEAKRWLGPTEAAEADAVSEDFDRGRRVVRRLFIGQVTVLLDGWEHLRTVLRIQTETLEGAAEPRVDQRYLISSMPSVRLTADHWLLVARRHWGVETSHQILDIAFEEDDHPWIEACPRAALVVAILRRIAYTMLALFRSVTQRSDERRATPWKTLMTDLFVALISTTEHDLRDPKLLRLR